MSAKPTQLKPEDFIIFVPKKGRFLSDKSYLRVIALV